MTLNDLEWRDRRRAHISALGEFFIAFSPSTDIRNFPDKFLPTTSNIYLLEDVIGRLTCIQKPFQ